MSKESVRADGQCVPLETPYEGSALETERCLFEDCYIILFINLNNIFCRSLNKYWECLMIPVEKTCGCAEASWVGIYNVMFSSHSLQAMNCQIGTSNLI